MPVLSWTGIMPKDYGKAVSMTPAGAAGRAARYLYAKKFDERRAAAAVNTMLGTRVFPGNLVPYVGLGDFEDEGITFNPDGSLNIPGLPSNTPNGHVGSVKSGSSYTYTTSGDTYTARPTSPSSASDGGSSWGDVFSGFFTSVGQGLGMRIAGRPTTTVPLPSSGPSMAAVLGIAALVGIPAVYLLTRKG